LKSVSSEDEINQSDSFSDIQNPEEILHIGLLSDITESTQLLNSHDADLSLFSSLLQKNVILFLISTSIIGLVYSAIGSYLFIYLSLTWRASQTLLGFDI
jgi:hypothetical protein